MAPGVSDCWETGRAPKQWAADDRLFFWESSPSKCLVGMGTLERPFDGYNANDKVRFAVKYLTKRIDVVIEQTELRSLPALKEASFLKAGPAGTVFPLDYKMAAVMYNLIIQRNPKLAKTWPDLLRSKLSAQHIVVRQDKSLSEQARVRGNGTRM